jgi:enoyl-CoA hydratase
VTGGLEVALQCTFLVASQRARFADTHARLGVMPGGGITVLMAQSMGLRRAIELSLTGNFLTADEALRLGLVNHVVPHEELLPFTRRLAADIAGNDQDAVRRLLQHYRQVAQRGDARRGAPHRGIPGRDLAAGDDPGGRPRAAVTARGRAQASDAD